MFSSVGAIVGLIEIEPAGTIEVPGDWAEPVEHGPACSDDTLAELLAQLAGRPSCQAALPSRLAPLPPGGHRTAGASGPRTAIVLDADLNRLAADLADETCRLRSRLAAVRTT